MEKYLLSAQDIQRLLPNREPAGHKGDFGRCLLLCGSRGFTGAAALAARGALTAGAGLIFLAVPEDIYAIEAVKLDEPVVLPLSRGWSEDSVPEILDLLDRKDAVLLGCGMGNRPGTRAVVEAVLKHARCPVVLDADGINCLSGHMDIVRGRKGPLILTPHEGEFLRIGGDLSRGREAGAVELARDLGAVVLLKGHRTLITDGGALYENPTGNPGMATGGCGDLLSGIITAFLGQGMDPLEAAVCGAWVHGAAGDDCAQAVGQYATTPTGMLSYLPRHLK